jgi:hypothetical protein
VRLLKKATLRLISHCTQATEDFLGHNGNQINVLEKVSEGISDLDCNKLLAFVSVYSTSYIHLVFAKSPFSKLGWRQASGR